MFINLNQHNFSESLDIILHELKNVNYNVDDIFDFDSEQLFSSEIIIYIV